MNTLSALNRICRLCQRELPCTDFDICTRYGHGKPIYQFYKSYCRPCEVWRVRVRKLARHYGMSVEDFRIMRETQNNKCKICGIEMQESGKKANRICVDHDHTTGRVRGMLCFSCNAALGMFKENTEAMVKAIEYIHPIEDVISVVSLC